MRRPCAAPLNGGAESFPQSAWARRDREVAARCADLQVVAAWCLDAGLAVDGGAGRGRASLRGARGILGRFLGGGELERAETSIEGACGKLRQLVDGQLALAGEGARLLSPAEAAATLADLANRPGVAAPGPGRGADLAWRLALSDIEAHPRHLEVGGEAVALLSVAEPPPGASPNALRELAAALEGAWTWHWEFRRLSGGEARKKIKSTRNHYFQKRYSLLAHAQDTQGTNLAMEDTAASSEADRLGAASRELEAEGMPYGEAAVGLAIHGSLKEVDTRAAEAAALLAAVDVKCLRETMGQLPAWFGRLPGAPRSLQCREMLVSAGAAATLAPLWGDPVGHADCRHLRAAPLAVLETRGRTRFGWDLFGGHDVGHTAIFGATGSGKSFFLNFFLVNALKYRPRVCVLDLGGSYRALTELVGGGYLALDPRHGRGLTLRPLDVPEGDASVHFLSGWVAELLALGGYACSGDDAGEIRKTVQSVFDMPPDRRALGMLASLLPPKMQPAMAPWVGNGAWGHIFDPQGGDDLDIHPDWQVIDISGADRHPDLCAAALSWFLEAMRVDIEDPAGLERFKVLVVDEAWKFLGDGSAGTFLAEAARTWRKRNAALVMATQSAGDVLGAEAAAQILESVPNRVYLANPDLASGAAEPLQLSTAEVDTIRRLQSKRELYLQRRAATAAGRSAGAVLRLEVGDMDRWLYTSDPREAAQRAEAIRRCGGIEPALAELARGRAA